MIQLAWMDIYGSVEIRIEWQSRTVAYIRMIKAVVNEKMSFGLVSLNGSYDSLRASTPKSVKILSLWAPEKGNGFNIIWTLLTIDYSRHCWVHIWYSLQTADCFIYDCIVHGSFIIDCIVYGSFIIVNILCMVVLYLIALCRVLLYLIVASFSSLICYVHFTFYMSLFLYWFICLVFKL